jgi:alpha-glucan, water dikinase
MSELQERLNGRLAAAWCARPALRPSLRLAMAAVGSGGPGDLGQRIRDDILAIQSAHGAKVTRCQEQQA